MRGMWRVRRLHVVTVLLIAASAAGAPWVDWGESPPKRFETYDELDRWAKTTTRHGGILYGLGPGEENLYYAGRHHDGERQSTESAVYRYEGISPGYQLVFYLPRELRTRRAARVQEGALVLSQWNVSTSDTLEMIVPLAMLPAFRRPLSRGGEWAHMGGLEGFPDETTPEITRDVAIGIARETLSDERQLVSTLQLRGSKKWGVVWSVEGIWSEPPPGMESTRRLILIDASSGKILTDVYHQWFIEKVGTSGGRF